MKTNLKPWRWGAGALLGLCVLAAPLAPTALADDSAGSGPSCAHLEEALQVAPDLAHYAHVVARAAECGLSVSPASAAPLCAHLTEALGIAPRLLDYPGVRGRAAECAVSGGLGYTAGGPQGTYPAPPDNPGDSSSSPGVAGGGPGAPGGGPGVTGGPGANGGGFGDLGGYGWAAGSIGLLARMGIIKGVAPGRFDPQGHVTHAQFAALMTRLFHLSAPASPMSFVDVPSSYWAYNDIEAAAPYMTQFHLPSGLAFEPSLDETRIEVAATIGQIEVAEGLAQLPSLSQAQGAWSQFKDGPLVPPGLVQAAAVTLLQGLMKGYPDGSFGVDGQVTRAEAAVLLARVLSGSETVGGTPPPLGGGSGGGSCGTVSGSVYCVTTPMS